MHTMTKKPLIQDDVRSEKGGEDSCHGMAAAERINIHALEYEAKRNQANCLIYSESWLSLRMFARNEGTNTKVGTYALL
mgnify:CR=1 FL=1